MPNQDLINPCLCGGAGPGRGWALQLAVAGAGAAAVVVAGAGAAHAGPDGSAGDEVGLADDTVATGSSAEIVGGGSWVGSSTGAGEDGDALVSLPPFPDMSAPLEPAVELQLPDLPEPRWPALDQPDGEQPLPDLVAQAPAPVDGPSAGEPDPDLPDPDPADPGRPDLEQPAGEHAAASPAAPEQQPAPEQPAPEQLLLDQPAPEPSGPGTEPGAGIAAAGPGTEPVPPALADPGRPVDGPTAPAGTVDPPRASAPLEPAALPSVGSTQVVAGGSTGVTAPAILPTGPVPVEGATTDPSAALGPDASPALQSVAQAPMPRSDAAEPTAVGEEMSFSGWTTPEETAALDAALGLAPPSRAATGSTAATAEQPSEVPPPAPGAQTEMFDALLRDLPTPTPADATSAAPPAPGTAPGPAAVAADDPSAPDGSSPTGGGPVPAAPPPGSTGTVQSPAGSGPGIRSVPIRADDDLADVSLNGAEQAAMVGSLFTEEGQRRLRALLSTERTVGGRDDLDLMVADVAEQLRQLALNSTPPTPALVDRFYPVPAPEDPLLAGWPDETKANFQRYHDDVNRELAERAMAGHSGFEAPEAACWVVCHRDGTSRVLPELHVGGNYHVSGDESVLQGLDLSDVTDVVALHTHPVFVGIDPPLTYNTSGLSAGDIGFLDAMGPTLAPHVQPGVASVSLLEGTVTIARRGPAPEGAPGAGDGSTDARGPLLVRVLPSTPGAPVSGELRIQGGDRGSLDYSLADAVEVPRISERRYSDAQRAAGGDAPDPAPTEPAATGPVANAPADVASWPPLGRRGLLLRPPASSVELPLPANASDRSVDPRADGDGAALPTAPDRTPSAGGVVVRPELPGYDPDLDPNAANRIPPDQPRGLDGPPDGRPADPSEFDPNQLPDQVPVDPAERGLETFPDRDEALERALAPDGVPGLFTSPVGAEEVAVAPIPDRGATPAGSGGDTVGPTHPAQPVRYASLPSGEQGVVVDEQRLSGTGNRHDRAGRLTTVEDRRTGERFVSVQPTRVANPDGTEILHVPQPGRGSVRVGYNPLGETVAVYRLAPGQTGRVTPSTPVQRITVRTRPGTPLEFNGGGGANAVPGVGYRDPVPDDPTLEEWAILPASTLNHDTGVRTYSAQVPAGYENRVDLTQAGVIRLRVPAGTRPVAVSRTEQAFTPYVPTSSPALTALSTPPPSSSRPPTPASPPPVRTLPRTPAAPAAPAPPQDQRNGLQRAGDFLQDNVLRPVGEGFERYQAWSREQLRTTVQGTQPLDGVVGFGVTRHRVWFLDGGRGTYDPQGRLLTVEAGDPPARINSTSLFLHGVGGTTALPARPGSAVPSTPPLRLRLAPR